jgi:hypothetical protein
MSDSSTRQLITPARQRGWGEILQLQPLTTSQDVALAVQRGAQVSIIPAGGHFYLSDFLSRPNQIREIDMRSRIFAHELVAPSRDPGQAFVVSLRISYRVADPASVAAAADPAGQFEQILEAHTRLLAGTLGHDQAGVLYQVLTALLRDDEDLAQELLSIGLALLEAEVAVGSSD